MTIYPDELKAQIRGAKMPVFAQGFDPVGANDCHNCGGLGMVYVFLVERGPFRDPPASRLNEGSVLKSTEDPMYGHVWYIGRTIGARCPVCSGVARKVSDSSKVRDTSRPIRDLAGKLRA